MQARHVTMYKVQIYVSEVIVKMLNKTMIFNTKISLMWALHRSNHGSLKLR